MNPNPSNTAFDAGTEAGQPAQPRRTAAPDTLWVSASVFVLLTWMVWTCLPYFSVLQGISTPVRLLMAAAIAGAGTALSRRFDRRQQATAEAPAVATMQAASASTAATATQPAAEAQAEPADPGEPGTAGWSFASMGQACRTEAVAGIPRPRSLAWLNLWCSGYDPESLHGTSARDVQQLGKLGTSVLFATIFAAFSWGLAGYTLADGAGLWIRALVALFTGTLGATIVLIFDRSFIYFVDSSSKGNTGKSLLFAAGRIAIALCLSTFTSQALIGWIMKPELNNERYRLIKEAMQSSDIKIGEGREQGAAKQAEQDNQRVLELRNALKQVPAELTARVKKAEDCIAQVAQARQRTSDQDARQRLAAKGQACKEQRQKSLDQIGQYRDKIQQQLDAASAQQAASRADLKVLQQKNDTQLQNRQKDAEQHTSVNSVQVLKSLLDNNAAARTKYYVISFLLLVCELLPLLQKLQAGQSTVGAQIAHNRQMAGKSIAIQAQQQEQDMRYRQQQQAQMHDTMMAALKDSHVREIQMAAQRAALLQMSELTALQVQIEELIKRDQRVRDMVAHHAPYAGSIRELWDGAVQRLLHSTPSTHPQGVAAQA